MGSMTKTQDQDGTDLAPVRDTVESIWVAIVLALALRAFMIEAFVIPTGSMAPRLMGDHQDLICASCGYAYAFGLQKDHGALPEPLLAPGAECPTCGAPFEGKARANSGDRVLVLKYLYRFREPRPWEVVVFKNPQDNRQNYIKRLVGLPGETLQIVHGDIFVKSPTGGQWHVRRKPPRAQDAMWQVIFDNDYRPREEWARIGNTPRWEPALPDDPAWDLTGNDGRHFAFRGGEARSLAFLASPRVFEPHYGYNSRLNEDRRIDESLDVCSDLKLSVVFLPQDADSRLGMTLTSFEHEFRAELNAGGRARLLHRMQGASGWTDEWDAADIGALAPQRGHQVALVHVDFRVELWVNGRRVLTSGDEEYRDDFNALVQRVDRVGVEPIPVPRVGIEASGSACELRHVRLFRDVYYTTPELDTALFGPKGDLARRRGVVEGMPGWATTGNPITLRLRKGSEDRDLDQFFVLGDNSPQSLDGRAWVDASTTLRIWRKDGKILGAYEDGAERVYKLGTVPRYALIGRALFVYWPGGFRVPGLPRLPIVPNAGKMRLIR